MFLLPEQIYLVSFIQQVFFAQFPQITGIPPVIKDTQKSQTICPKKMIQMNLFTKNKQIHRSQNQIYGYQGENVCGGGCE